MDIEFCIETIDEAMAAANYGVKRVELCAALEVGGLTPSHGLIKSCVALEGAEVHVMIRPRGGNFVYSAEEIEIMKEDILMAASLGAHGVVYGLLDPYNAIDFTNTKALAILARELGLETTFHRAIDFTMDLQESLNFLQEIGIDRVLSSGQSENVDLGQHKIAEMVKMVGGGIQIMAGGGVNPKIAAQLCHIKVAALHFTIRKPKGMLQEGMGAMYEVDEQKIKNILDVVQNNTY